MSNQPHPDRKAVTWRLHRDLVAAAQLTAEQRGETVLALATRAIEREIVRHVERDPWLALGSLGRNELVKHPAPWRVAYGPGDDLGAVVDANGKAIELDDPYGSIQDVIVAAVNELARD